MRIAHITDLHIGKHNTVLATNLKARLAVLKPDLVVCSGDVVDSKGELVDDAGRYLDELVELLPVSQEPRLIVVPGNHDMRQDGWLWKGWENSHARVFGTVETNHYYEKDNVWVFGFDSAEEGKVLGSGLIKDVDIDRFHQTYETLKATKPQFAGAFKIVVVHHHPLPVNWDHNDRERWLTMTNAGHFLSAVLFRQVDLVLHGHEHLQAKARLWSTLGNNDHQTTVVSLGATLHRLSNPDRNWFSLIDINNQEGVQLNFYGSVSDAFSEAPERETFWIRTAQASADLRFNQAKNERGFAYRAVASVTLINRDGDSRRSIECDDLVFTREPAGNALPVAVPHTSGYLDKIVVKGRNGPYLAQRPLDDARVHDFATTVAFDQKPAVNTAIDYVLQWHTVNSFAMDRRQFDHLQPGENQRLDNIEFTHFDVSDPIEQLTVIARFPEGFRPIDVRLRVTFIDRGSSSRVWDNVPLIEESLKKEYALRYFESIHIAALRVRMPQVGLSYGIQWNLPDPPRRPRDQASDDIRAVVDHLSKHSATVAQRDQVASVLAGLVETSRELLMPSPRNRPWSGIMEASLMMFDAGEHRLNVLAAVSVRKDKAVVLDFNSLSLAFGDGIAGRAFKTNQPRLYLKLDDEESEESSEPQLYRKLEGVEEHSVLLSIPVQAPAAEVWPSYGVLSIGSSRPDCPLRQLRPDLAESESKVSAFKAAAEARLHEELRRIFLEDDAPETPRLDAPGGQA